MQLEQLLKDNDFLDDAVLSKSEVLAEEFKGVANSQARKYFNDIKMLKRMAEAPDVDWNFIKVRLRLFLAQLAYAEKRPGRPVKPEFRTFFQTCLMKVIDDPKSIVSFSTFLEAVYAYYYAKEGYRRK